MNGCRLGFYEPIRSNLTQTIFHDSSVQSLGINVFSGASSGILGAAAGSPFFLVKTRLQSFSPFLPVGTQHQYRNARHALSQIYSNEGVKGLYRGVVPALVRTGFGSSVQLPTYFFAKRRLQRHVGMSDGPALHLASSACSGFVVCVVMHPSDTIMNREVMPFHEQKNANFESGCTTKPETCTITPLNVCGKQFVQKAFSQFTRVSSHISPVYYLIRFVTLITIKHS